MCNAYVKCNFSISEWYDVQPLVARGLYRAPYFEETAHITTLLKDTY